MDNRMPLRAVQDFLMQEHIADCPVAVALSGGADSVCLLLCLLHWKKLFRLDISAIHVQHNLRGAESQRDEQFCRQLCMQHQTDLQVISVDVQAYQAQHQVSLETAARACRYQAFAASGKPYIATAHTASDNLETVLFRLARGTGLKGMCGIPPRRDGYLRPLLTVSRQEIEAFLRAEACRFVTDSSNLEDVYSRNFIRHQICPALHQLTGNPEQAVWRMTDIFRQEEAYLAEQAQQAYRQRLQPDGTLCAMQQLHPALQRRCIALFLEENGIPASYQHILQVQRLVAEGGQAELVRQQVTARASHGELCLVFRESKDRSCEHPEAVLEIGTNQIFPGYTLTAEVISGKNREAAERIYKKFANSALDYDIIRKYAAQPPVLHGRRPGMSIRLPGRQHSIRIKKWLQTQPVGSRETVHYLSDETGLLWVQGLGVAAHVAVTDRTERVLILHVHKTDTECT